VIRSHYRDCSKRKVLSIEGETGTGKELMAWAIHQLSRRREKPFIAINSGALPDTLLESELFGYKAGAFTDATKDKPGHFAVAEGGTIFLDEISDVSPAFQVRLLRVLQDRTFQPLGATKSLKADVRIIAATNKSLEDLVRKGIFRQDLYYRINVVKLELPPLRERKEDIPILIKHLISRLNCIQGKAVTGISPNALALLMSHDYPGNIRELENIIEHAFVLCPQGEIDTNALPHGLVGLIPRAPTHHRMGAAKKALETQILLDALKRSNYNRAAAARDLGLHKSTFFRKIKSLEIELPNQDGRASRQGK